MIIHLNETAVIFLAPSGAQEARSGNVCLSVHPCVRHSMSKALNPLIFLNNNTISVSCGSVFYEFESNRIRKNLTLTP